MKLTKASWILVSLLGLILFLFFFFVFSVYGNRFVIDLPLYFFLVVVISLAATALLAGAMKSAAVYDGPVGKGKLHLAGPVVIFLVILAFGYRFRPVPQDGPILLTINAFGPKGRGEVLTSGLIRVQDGNEQKVGYIDGQGISRIPVDARNKGKQMIVTSSGSAYQLHGGFSTITLPNSDRPMIDLQFEAIADTVSVHGNVSYTHGGRVKDASILIVNFTKKAVTDADGDFTMNIPGKEGDLVKVIIYVGDSMKYNGDRNVSKTWEFLIDK